MKDTAGVFATAPTAGVSTLLDSSSKFAMYGFTAFDLAFYGINQSLAAEINADTKTYQDAFLTGSGKDTYIPDVIGGTKT